MSRKISQFTEATTIKSGDISIVVQDGETKQFPLDLLATKSQADEYKTGVETQLADYEQEIADVVKNYGMTIISGKGRTNYGIATSVCVISQALLKNRVSELSVALPDDALQTAVSKPHTVSAKGVN